MSYARKLVTAASALLLSSALSIAAAAQDHSQIYSVAEIDADAERLERPIRKLHEIFLDYLTPEEKAAIDGLLLEFPRPQEGDPALTFYAFSDFGEKVIVMPVMSLKMLEDVTTAYAYLLNSTRNPGAIDLYFTMIGREDPSGFPEGRYPALLPALGIPADAWKLPQVDQLSLSFRNEAFAFAFAHELGHVVLRHRGYDDVTSEQALADEIAADQFALDLLARTKTPPIGAALFFQAQAFSLPNRGLFATEEAWRTYYEQKRTHPLTTDRIRAFAAFAETSLAAGRPAEQAIWTFVNQGLSFIAGALEDPELQACMARIRRDGTIDILKQEADPDRDLFAEFCL